MSETILVCNTCLHYEPEHPEQANSNGFCHRYPPQICGRESIHPKVYKMDYCGEWKYKNRE